MKSFTLVVLLCTLVMLMSGCVTTDKPVYLDNQTKKATFEEQTNGVPNIIVYADAEGKPTLAPADDDGKPNARYTMQTPADWIGTISELGSKAPAPWGAVLGGLGTLLFMGVSTYTGLANRKKKGMLDELILSIEDNPEAKKAVIEKSAATHSPALKKEVKKVT